MQGCEHKNFSAVVKVHRLEDVKCFNAFITIQCVECQTPFTFVGLPTGLSLAGAAMSVDGTEGRFAIVPRCEKQDILDDVPVGFSVQRGH